MVSGTKLAEDVEGGPYGDFAVATLFSLSGTVVVTACVAVKTAVAMRVPGDPREVL